MMDTFGDRMICLDQTKDTLVPRLPNLFNVQHATLTENKATRLQAIEKLRMAWE